MLTNNFSSLAGMSEGEIEAERLVARGTIESFKDSSIRRSAEFWKAVERWNKILREWKARENKRLPF